MSGRTIGAHSADKNGIGGALKELNGAANVAVGKPVGDGKWHSEGKIDSPIVGANDAIRDASKVK